MTNHDGPHHDSTVCDTASLYIDLGGLLQSIFAKFRGKQQITIKVFCYRGSIYRSSIVEWMRETR